MKSIEYQYQKDRIEWIDFAKGVTILLVIAGHTISSNMHGSVIRGVIFSFHMPLFFILSAVTYQLSKNNIQFTEKIKKSFTHLLIPAFIIFLLWIIHSIWSNPSDLMNSSFWMKKLFTLILASGIGTDIYGTKIEGIGIPWFFFVLFTGRTLFEYFHLKLSPSELPIVCGIVSFLGILAGQQRQTLPFSIDIALSVMPFFYVGYKLKNFNLESHCIRNLCLHGIFWAATLFICFSDWKRWTYMELATRRYPLYPMCFLTAISGTMVICYLSSLATKIGKLITPVIYIGKYSLYILLVHCMDELWRDAWSINEHQLYSAALRILTDLFVFFILMIVLNIFRKIRLRKIIRA